MAYEEGGYGRIEKVRRGDQREIVKETKPNGESRGVRGGSVSD